MSEFFNPYHEWLELDQEVTQPNHYQLIQVEEFESSEQTISAAADRAMSRVRSFRPGQHAALWAQVLDEIKTAKACLLDLAHKSNYDAQLRQTRPSAGTSSIAESSASTGGTNAMYPPGMAGNPSTPPAAQTTAATPATGNVPVLEPADITATPIAIPIPATTDPGPVYADPMLATGNSTTPVANAPVANPIQPITANPSLPQNPTMPFVATPVTQSMPNPQAGPIDPMAPLPDPSASAPIASATTVNPTSPAAIDPMAPAPGFQNGTSPIPAATPSPMAAVATQPAATPLMATPLGGAMFENPSADVPPAVESDSSPAQMASQREKRSMQTPAMIAVGLGMFAIFATGAFVVMGMFGDDKQVAKESKNQKSNKKIVSTEDGSTDSKPKQQTIKEQPRPRPRPESKSVSISKPKVDPMPKVVPTPTVDPPPKPKPEPTPTTIPEPKPEPKPVVKPTREEVIALGKALTTAKNALADKNFDIAAAELKKAEPLAKLPEHKAKWSRLNDVATHVGKFWDFVVEGATKLDAGDELKFSETTIVVIIESSASQVVYRVAGTNRRSPPRELPDGLAILVADRAISPDDPLSKVVKGALYAVNVGKNPDNKGKALSHWQLAATGGADVESLLPFLEDEYDLVKDLNE